MKFSIQREALLKALQMVSGVVEKRQTLPILANVLMVCQGDKLSITGTDLEIELKAFITLDQPSGESGKTTIPGKKLLDICRNLPEHANIDIHTDKDRILLYSGQSRFSLSTLPSDDFPNMEERERTLEFSISQRNLLYLIQRTHFAMAQQDVRYYLNGMLLEVKEGIIRAVATDGHRLALNTIEASVVNNSFLQVIIPRKGIMELMHLLSAQEKEIKISVNPNFIRINGPDFTFTSKLVDGNFPDYERVIPKGGNKTITLHKDALKQALTRASILSNEKFRGVRMQFRNNLLRILANNPEQEEAEEKIHIEYQHDDMDIGLNVTYLLDILNTLRTKVKLTLSNSESSVLLEEVDEDGNTKDGNSLFVVMPMRL